MKTDPLHTFIRYLRSSGLLVCGCLLIMHAGEAQSTKADEALVVDSLLIESRKLPVYDERLAALRKIEHRAEKIGYRKGLMQTYNQVGVVYFMKGEMERAELYFRKYYTFAVKLRDTVSITKALNNRASVKLTIGQKEEALNIFQMALEYLANGDQTQFNSIWFNIGLIYKDLKDYKRAVSVLRNINTRQDADPDTRIKSCNALGIIYKDLAKYDSAFYFIRLGLRWPTIDEHPLDRSELYNTLGTVFSMGRHLDSSLYFYEKALDIARKQRYSDNELIYRINIIETLRKLHKNREAHKMLLEIEPRFRESADAVGRKTYYLLLANSCRDMGDYKNAIQGFLLYKKEADYLDSLNNLSHASNFESNVKKRMSSIRDSLRNVRKREADNIRYIKQTETLKRSRERTTWIGIILAVVVIALIIAFRAFRSKAKSASTLQKQRDQISEQKDVIEEKNRELTDSINYAQQLQQAILPPTENFERIFTEAELIYLPRDIVAGDFYFYEEVHRDNCIHIVFAVADCTGHGVPGALVSVVCANALTRCVKEFGLTDPGEILDKSRELVIETFEKSGNEVKDGMDISLASLELRMKNEELKMGNAQPATRNSKLATRNSQLATVLRWAGANNPLWILRAGAGQVEEIKPTKQPIGKYDHPAPFRTHEIALQTGDQLMLFTDGFTDQFGGASDKKLKSSRLKDKWLQNRNLPLAEQGKLLEGFFRNWQGNFQQTDDVCVLICKV